MWVTTEVFRDPALLSRIRSEVKGSVTPREISTACFDVNDLLKLPRLKAVYAESLRLRIHVIIPREPDRDDLRVSEWVCPKNSTILVATHPAHMDHNVWNTGSNNAHPVDQFWAERFLVYPNDPRSGPYTKESTVAEEVRDAREAEEGPPDARSHDSSGPQCIISGAAGHWFPYGGGPRICPGRHFAKRAILTATSIMVSIFDIQIIASEAAMEMDNSCYGLGMQRPVGKIRYRIRKRRGATW